MGDQGLDVEALIRDRLAGRDATDRKSRIEEYDTVERILRKEFAADPQQRILHLAELEAVKARFEGAHDAKGSWFRREIIPSLGKSALAVESAKARYGAAGGLFVFAGTFAVGLSTLNRDLAFPAAGTLAAGAIVVGFIGWLWRKDWGGTLLVFAGALLLFASTVAGWRVVLMAWPDDDKQAVVVRGPALDSIETNTAGAKREQSSDPRKELANLGVLWTSQSFFEAVRADDTRIAELFFKGGWRINPDLAWEVFRTAKPNMQALFLRYRHQMEGDTCNRGFVLENCRHIDTHRDAFIAFCGVNAARASAAEALQAINGSDKVSCQNTLNLFIYHLSRR